MTERQEPQPDQDPAPLKHTDAERVSSDEAGGGSPGQAGGGSAEKGLSAEEKAEEIEEDPAQNPGEQPLRDIKGG